jgi:hypothetical protein
MIAVAGWPQNMTSTSSQRGTRQLMRRVGRWVINPRGHAAEGTEGMQHLPADLEDPDTSPGLALATFADLTGTLAFGEPIRAEIKRLDELAQLGANWDSYGAHPISPDALAMAYLVLATTSAHLGYRVGSKVRPDVIVPVADGGVQLEWRGPGGLIEVSVGPDESLGYLLIRNKAGEQTTEERDDVPFSVIQRLIADVVRG